MKSLPVPRTVSGWVLSIILIALSFYIYYNYLFEPLLGRYYNVVNYQNFRPANAYSDNVEINVLSPQNISRYIAQELIIKVVGKGDPENVSVIVSTYDVKTQSTDSSTVSIVLLCTSLPPDNFTGCQESRNKVDFGIITKNEEASKSLWLIVSPRVQSNITDIEFRFSDESGQEIEFEQKWIAKIEDQGAVAQSFLRIILLPPWANGFIPVMAFLVIHIFEHKIQPGRIFRYGRRERFYREVVNNSDLGRGGS